MLYSPSSCYFCLVGQIFSLAPGSQIPTDCAVCVRWEIANLCPYQRTSKIYTYTSDVIIVATSLVQELHCSVGCMGMGIIMEKDENVSSGWHLSGATALCSSSMHLVFTPWSRNSRMSFTSYTLQGLYIFFLGVSVSTALALPVVSGWSSEPTFNFQWWCKHGTLGMEVCILDTISECTQPSPRLPGPWTTLNADYHFAAH